MFGFPSSCHSRTSFNRNFLKSVVFQIQFKSNDEIIDKKEEIIGLFCTTFPRIQDTISKGFEVKMNANQTPVIHPISDNNAGYQMRTQNGQSTITFSRDIINFISAGKDYKTFDDFFSGISEINEVFKISGINEVSRIAIRKINIIDFKIPETEESCPMDVLGMVLSSDLLSNSDYFPNKHYIKNNIHTINFINDNNLLNLKYGLICPNVNSKNGQIVIDIDLIDKNINAVQDLKKISKTINEEIFNIFCWTLCNDAIKHLKS